jgi:hypothetical protein
MTEPHDPALCETCKAPDYETFRHDCVHESTDHNELWLERFNIKTWPTWVYSLDDATLTFSQNGSPRVLCNIQVVGTVQDDTWQWSWSNHSLPPHCCDRLSEVKAFGRQKGWMKLSAPFLNADEYFGWDCAAIARHLLQAQSVYRCPTDDAGFVYLVILSTHFVA